MHISPTNGVISGSPFTIHRDKLLNHPTNAKFIQYLDSWIQESVVKRHISQVEKNNKVSNYAAQLVDYSPTVMYIMLSTKTQPTPMS